MVSSVLGAASVALLLGGCSASGPSAATLYSQTVATTKNWSVHYASSGTAAGVTLLISGDAGPASGSQEILVGKGTVTDSASLVLIGGITYLRGNARALSDLTGLLPTQAAANAGKWVQFATDNSAFSQVVAGVRSHDVAEELELKGPFTLGPARTIDGVKVDAIMGTQKFQGQKATRAVLFVRASGRHVPVEEDTVNAKGQLTPTEHTVYSLWGETVRPTAPTASVTIGPVGVT